MVIKEKKANVFDLQPELKIIESDEQFGLVASDHVVTFGGLLTIKDEEELEEDTLHMPLHELVSEDDVLYTLGIDPTSLLIPEGGQEHHLPSASLIQARSETSVSDANRKEEGSVIQTGD